MHKSILITAIAATGFAAHADIVRVEEFESLQFEGFQDLNMDVFENGSVEILGGLGTIFNSDSSFLHATSGWSYKSLTHAYEGDKLLGTASGGIGYQFASEQRSFGGMFSSIDLISDGTVKFFSGEQLIGTDTLLAGNDGDWEWNGWSTNDGFDRVVIESNSANNGFMMHDAVRVLSTPVPAQGTLAILAGSGLLMIRRRR